MKFEDIKTIDDLIKYLRGLRTGKDRVRITNTIHDIERYSLGTEISFSTLKEDDIKDGKFKFELKNEKLVLKK